MKRLASSLVAIAAFAACSDSPTSPPRSLSTDSPAASVSSAAVTARSGRATVATVATLNQPVVRVINVGPITTHPVTATNSAATISVPPVLTARILNAGVQTRAAIVASNTSLAEATIVAGVNVIVVRVLTTRAQASCNGVDFTFRIVELTINGVKQIVTSQPNVVIPVIGGSVTINEQKLHTPTSGTINALHVDLGSTLDVKIGTATATVVCN